MAVLGGGQVSEMANLDHLWTISTCRALFEIQSVLHLKSQYKSRRLTILVQAPELRIWSQREFALAKSYQSGSAHILS
jgi:hypothetical protein